jgi:hypothetical protein
MIALARGIGKRTGSGQIAKVVIFVSVKGEGCYLFWIAEGLRVDSNRWQRARGGIEGV